MTLQGYQFDKAKVTPEADAQLYSYLAQSSDNKVISGLTVTATGLNVYVASGKALVQGRLIENTQQMQLTAQANKTGYVCITIDLTQTNTSTGTPGTSSYIPVNNQLRLELVETLIQQDLNTGGGLIYTFPLYSYVSTGTSITLIKNKYNFSSIMIEKTLSLNDGIEFNFVRRGNLVTASVFRQTRTTNLGSENIKLTQILPVGLRPSADHAFHINRNANTTVQAPMIFVFNSVGEVRVTSGTTGTSIFQGTTMYYTDDPIDNN
ncbi:hypothetical protein GU334_02745 [Lactococcus raffinolactis]|uniref:Uncharacterized protein n=1 Tax=Pseudolactococcus raffinolactis TaxID=1366 RepID=A0AAE7CRV7_9LACT|nr:hypothetical protein [Lactococcus raffinolactis]QIW57904.1 hypothetical protein GU334_02745 [Lactococcus raffinolactis]